MRSTRSEIEGDSSSTFWGRYEKVVVTSGLSKAFALPGLRIGWVVAPKELIEQIWIHHDYLTLTPGLLGDRLGAIAMEPVRREAILARTRKIIRSNLPLLEEWLNEYSHLIHDVRPVAGAIAYFEYDLAINSTDLINRLLKEKSVLLVPGDQFGLDKGIRVSFGYDIQSNEIRNQSPLGRVATPEEVAHTVLFLAAPGSEWLTGGVVDLNGASYLR